MVVETGDFPDFRHGKAHPVGKRGEVARRKMAVVVLDNMKAFDEKIAARRFGTEKCFDFGACRKIDKAAFWLVLAFATT